MRSNRAAPAIRVGFYDITAVIFDVLNSFPLSRI